MYIAGNDGTDLALAAEIRVEVDGVPGSNDMPGRILLRTTPDGSQAPVDAVKIDSAQNVTVSAGNLVIGTSGKGIDFSATPGTGTSELLADYEEGTWTPGQGVGAVVVGTFSSAGFYTKVGRLVTVSGVLVGSTSIVATNGTVVVTGLPFASNATSTGVFADSSYNGISGARTSGSDILAVGTTSAAGNLVFSITYQV
jgi:hypothetical protein